MRTRNGRSLNDLFWRSVRRTGANRPAIALFLMGFSGSLALVPHGGTCPKSSANGRASTGIRRWTLAGLWEDIMDDLNQSGAALDALQMIDSTVVAPIIRQRAQKGDPATGFWPLKRWLHDQDPPPRGSFAVFIAKSCRALLQQAEECSPCRNPLRQNRRELPWLHRHHVNPPLAPSFVNMT